MNIDNIREVINENYYDIIQFSQVDDLYCITLDEAKEEDCKVHLTVSRKENLDFLIIKNLEGLKENSGYIIKNPPKDCDYIIIDIYKKRVYVIELKHKKDFDRTSDLVKQLDAGECWLQHILFCTKNENILENPEWEKYWININTRCKRPIRKASRHDKTILDKNFIVRESKRPLRKIRGNHLILESLITK